MRREWVESEKKGRQIHIPKVPRRETRGVYGRLFREIYCRKLFFIDFVYKEKIHYTD